MSITSLQVLNVSEEFSIGIFQVLSAILWIGNLDFRDTDSEACQLTSKDNEIAKKIATLLGISDVQIAKVCTIRQISVKGTTTDIALKFHEVKLLSLILDFTFNTLARRAVYSTNIPIATQLSSS